MPFFPISFVELPPSYSHAGIHMCFLVDIFFYVTMGNFFLLSLLRGRFSKFRQIASGPPFINPDDFHFCRTSSLSLRIPFFDFRVGRVVLLLLPVARFSKFRKSVSGRQS